MYTRWTDHLRTDEEKEAFKKKIYSAKEVLDRLKQIYEDDLMMLDRSEVDGRIYSIPNWDYLQAHKNGNRQIIMQHHQLVNLDQQKGNISDHKPTGPS